MHRTVHSKWGFIDRGDGVIHIRGGRDEGQGTRDEC